MNSPSGTRRADPRCAVLGPSGLCKCVDVFHPFHHHVFFSSPFCRMLLRSKNSKSTAPLTLISMPRCVLCCQDFSASCLQAAPSPGSPRFPLSPRVPHPGVCFSLGLSAWEWEMQLPGCGFALNPPCFWTAGAFSGMSGKRTSGRIGEGEGAICLHDTIVFLTFKSKKEKCQTRELIFL